jgi:integrase/recombinase XerD
MSGGPYGRGKAPERGCRPIANWPEADRQSWLDARRPADVLDEHISSRACHSEASNFKAQKGYGRWLTFLATTDPGCLSELPADRITKHRVAAYVENLRALGNSTATILARLQELGEVAKVFASERSWTFINMISSKVRARHQPARDKSNLRLSDELLGLGLELIDRAALATGLSAAILHRDGLMIALLALVPLRRRNMAELRLLKTLVDIDGLWIISFDASETKTHAAFEVGWPDELLAPLKVYLDVHRPFLASLPGRWSKPVDDFLWVSSDGSPMTQMAIYDRVRKHTAEAFGVPINPHLFRDAAATTLAIADPEHVRVAAPLLGHRTFTTTERHYQQAKSLEAHRTYVGTLFAKGKQNDCDRSGRAARRSKGDRLRGAKALSIR